MVERQKDLVWVTEFFDVFRLVGKKRHDYAIWREAVIEHANGMPPAQLATYKDELAEARRFREAASLSHPSRVSDVAPANAGVTRLSDSNQRSSLRSGTTGAQPPRGVEHGFASAPGLDRASRLNDSNQRKRRQA